jgi:hypothetical protein
MNIEIEIQKCKSYTNPFNCGIAKGLRRKGILFPIVSSCSYRGLFLGLIPVWGTISEESDDIAYMSDKEDFIPTKTKIGLFN